MTLPAISWRWLPFFLLSASVAAAQELEPGAYAVAPVGVNVVVVSNTLSFGDMSFDPAGPIEDAEGVINVTAFGYGRVLNIAGRSGQAAVAVPVVVGHLQGRYLGEFEEVTRSGPGDARLRMAVNLYGAPARGLREFAANRATRLLGASLTVAMPTGPYTSERLINVGGDRWAFKPELGFVQVLGRWTVETFGGVWMFTKNDPFFRGSVRTQKPIGSAQFHVHYVIQPRLSLSGNANFYSGGRTTVNGRENFDLQKNSRVGVTMAKAFGRGQIIRVAFSRGAYTTIGAAFNSLSMSWQRGWGGSP